MDHWETAGRPQSQAGLGSHPGPAQAVGLLPRLLHLQLHSLHLCGWMNTALFCRAVTKSGTVDQWSSSYAPLIRPCFCTLPTAVPNCPLVLHMLLVPQLMGEHFIGHLRIQTTDQQFSLSSVPVSIPMQLFGYSIALHPHFIKMSGNRKKTEVLALLMTNIALKLQAVEAKLEILSLVNSREIFLKLQYLFSFNFSVMVNFKCLMNFWVHRIHTSSFPMVRARMLETR